MSGMVIRVVGAGQIGMSHIKSLRKLSSVDAILVNDLDPAARAKGVAEAKKARADDGRTRADLTIIGTQSHQHWTAARQFLDRGEALYVEKPVSLNMDEVRWFADAERTGAWICVGQNMRLMKGPRAIRLLGDIGLRILTLHKYRLRGPRDPHPLYGAAYYKNRGSFGYDGGVLAQQAEHLFDLACHIMGPAKSAWAIGANLEHDIECEDTGSAILDFGGPMASLHGTTAAHGAPGDYGKSAEVTVMTVAARDGNASIHDWHLDKFDWWTFDKQPGAIIGGRTLSLRNAALTAIENGEEPPVTVASCVDGILALHAAYRSMDSGKPEVPGEPHDRLGQAPHMLEAA